MDIKQAIRFLDKTVPNPSQGLPPDIFYFVSRMTTMVNVDLLIKDENGRTLLAWRDDKFNGQGWHIPGGIIRFKEKWEDRIRQVAISEIGTPVKFDPQPIAINQVICKPKNRGHFISLLFKCFLPASFVPKNANLTETSLGFLKWHQTCPPNLIQVHHFYKKFL